MCVGTHCHNLMSNLIDTKINGRHQIYTDIGLVNHVTLMHCNRATYNKVPLLYVYI